MVLLVGGPSDEGSLWVPPKEVVVLYACEEGQAEAGGEGPSWVLEDQALGGACVGVVDRDAGAGAEEGGHQGP